MFSNTQQIRKRTPENGTDRESYLSLLVDEYLNSPSYDARSQVLANLANFAYDPINYGHIRNVGVLDIFLHVLKTDDNEKLIHFASAGICNLCLDPKNAEYILKYGSLDLLKTHLKSKHNETVANIITTLIYLCNEQNKPEINTAPVIDIIKSLEHSSERRLVSLAKIFLKDVTGGDMTSSH